MKELLIFRTFTLFPLVGILIPDVANKLDSSLNAIPPEHLIIEITLIICTFISSAGIWAARQAMENSGIRKSKAGLKPKRRHRLAGKLKKGVQIQPLKQLPRLAE